MGGLVNLSAALHIRSEGQGWSAGTGPGKRLARISSRDRRSLHAPRRAGGQRPRSKPRWADRPVFLGRLARFVPATTPEHLDVVAQNVNTFGTATQALSQQSLSIRCIRQNRCFAYARHFVLWVIERPVRALADKCNEFEDTTGNLEINVLRTVNGVRRSHGDDGAFGRFALTLRTIARERTSQTPVGNDQEDRRMSESRTKGRRSPARAFRPTIDGELEARLLLASPRGRSLSSYLLSHTTPKAALNLRQPPFTADDAPPFHKAFHRITTVGTQTAHGGQAVEVTALDGSHYLIKLDYSSNTLATATGEGANGQLGNASTVAAADLVSQQNANYPQPIGTVRAYAMSGGRVGIIVNGSTPNTELTINPLGLPQAKGYAHSFAYGESTRNHVLNIGQISVDSGEIGAILGFQDAVLSGPLVVSGAASIDRIAFDELLPGATISTGGDLQTLDISNSATLSGPGTGVFVGRDLNLLNVGSNLALSDGANFIVGRNLGLVPQPPKGTGTGSNILALNFTIASGTTITTTIPSVGGFIQGNITIAPGSTFGIGSLIRNTLYVSGSVTLSNMFIFYGSASQTNPPFEPSLPFPPDFSPPATAAGGAPNGYVTALGGSNG